MLPAPFPATLLFTALVVCCLIEASLCYRVQTEKDAVEYLKYYGYVDPHEMPEGFTLKDCTKKLRQFQSMSHVKVTGKLDKPTLDAMNAPRCGCPDFIQISVRDDSMTGSKEFNGSQTNDHATNNNRSHHRYPNHNHFHGHHHNDHHHSHDRNDDFWSSRRNFVKRHSRSKRYVSAGRRWQKEVVTYSIIKYPSRTLKISSVQLEDAIHQAFSIWEQHINLEFRYQPNNIEADIAVSFATASHGDNYPFDGAGKTLAHAFFPGSGLGGDVHFEEEEDWTLGSYNGVDVLYVAVHELGHSLGLGHSSDYGAIMYPMYRGYIPNLQLHHDDITGVQSIYGRKDSRFTTSTTTTTTTRRPTTTRRQETTTTRRFLLTTSTPKFNHSTTRATPTKPSWTENEDLCLNPQIDAITTMLGDAILIFKGSNVYEVGKNGEGVLTGWPQRIDRYFRGLEGDLDCAVTRSNGKTYFFKGTRYWRFTGRQMDRGYPRAMAQHFPGIPNDLDAAAEWDGEFVFTKGDQFWRFNTRTRPQIQPYFPMPLNHWGLTKKLDAVFTAPDGSINFFQDSYMWEFDRSTHQIKSSQGPVLISEKWFGCLEP